MMDWSKDVLSSWMSSVHPCWHRHGQGVIWEGFGAKYGNKWKSISWTRKHHLPMIPMYQFIQKDLGLFSGKSLQGLFCASLANCWGGLPSERQNGGVNRGIIYIYLMILCHPWKIRESHLGSSSRNGKQHTYKTWLRWNEMKFKLSWKDHLRSMYWEEFMTMPAMLMFKGILLKLVFTWMFLNRWWTQALSVSFWEERISWGTLWQLVGSHKAFQ